MTQPFPLSHRRRALIVDDELMAAVALKADLQACGFDVCDLATNRQEAFRLAMSKQPDVVVMDVCLEGGREGIEVARWLREVCEVPIIFVSEYIDRDTLERIHKQVPGASVLHKPISRQRLFDAVAEVSKVHTADLKERYASTTV
jgi:DNA-binding response OmpR family regulator